MTDYTLDDQPAGSARYRYGDLESVIMFLGDQLCDGKIGGNIFLKKCHREDFVIDFCCFQKKLAIIISDENPSYNDYYSDLFGNLYRGGFRVVMFPKQDVMNNSVRLISFKSSHSLSRISIRPY